LLPPGRFVAEACPEATSYQSVKERPEKTAGQAGGALQAMQSRVVAIAYH
jgi:hypothetical protein